MFPILEFVTNMQRNELQIVKSNESLEIFVLDLLDDLFSKSRKGK